MSSSDLYSDFSYVQGQNIDNMNVSQNMSYELNVDSVSQHGSSVSQLSTSSARAHAAARKAALKAKRDFMEKTQELELRQIEQECLRKEKILQIEEEMDRERWRTMRNLKLMEIEGEIQAASAEEDTLAKFCENPRLEESDVEVKVELQRDSVNNASSDGALPVVQDATNPVVSDAVPSVVQNKAPPVVQESVLNPLAREYHVADNQTAENISISPKQMGQIFQECLTAFHGSQNENASSMKAPMMTDGNFESQLLIQRQLLDIMSLPKLTLMTFDGDPLQYSAFMSAFDSCIGNMCVDDAAKLNRLFEYCKGKALRVIKPCAVMKPHVGYPKARQILKERFGNDYQITEALVMKVVEGPEIKANNGSALQDLADDLHSCAETLKALNKLDEIDTRGRMVKIVSRLPFFLQGRWRKYAVDTLDMRGTYPNIEEFVTFVKRAAREMNDPVFGFAENKKKDTTVKAKSSNRSTGSLFNVQASKGDTAHQPKDGRAKAKQPEKDESKPKSYCVLCNETHSLKNCSKFASMPAGKRFETAKEHQLCFNCLEEKSHRAQWCRKSSACGLEGCSAKHSRLLHYAFNSVRQQSEPAETQGSQANTDKPADVRGQPRSYACRQSSQVEQKIVLPIVPVMVRGSGQTDYIQTHALLDTGSNRTFCSSGLASELGLTGEETTVQLETLNATRDSSALQVSLEITGTGRFKKNGAIHLQRVFALDKFPDLTSSCATSEDISRCTERVDAAGLNIAATGVRLIIGQDNPRALAPLEVRLGRENEPYATRTILGWTLNGPLQEDVDCHHDMCNFVNDVSKSETNLEALAERFWKIDSVPGAQSSITPQMSVDDRRVLDVWNKTAKLEDGHYVMDVPFKSDMPDLPNNRVLAEKRLQSLKRRLSRDPELHAQYTKEMNNMLEKGIAERAPDVETPGLTWYIPHHNVKNPKKPDKFRIVFDCAAEYHGTSLNKTVSQGPDLMNKMLGVLLRFRKNRIAVIADIEAMFLQVFVSPHHRDALRFLWWEGGDMSKDPVVYRMTTHLFGGVWCPSCAAYTLRRTAQDNKDDFPPDVIEVVENNFYVDDCLSSVKDVESAIELQKNLCQLLAKGGFRLTKWMSNNRDVIEAIAEEDRAKQLKTLEFGHDGLLPSERALGVHWHAETDTIGLQIKVDNIICTRRGILALMSSVFDPLGFVGPYILLAKKIFQKECRLNKGWDEELQDENRAQWMKWVHDLPLLKEIQIDRCLIPEAFTDAVRVELHHFADASQEAFGAVSYLRLVNKDSEVHCSFLIGKTRLAPMKQVTIPRLELMAAVVAVQLDAVLRKELKMDIDESTFWSDSMIVLQYIKNTTRRFHTFVANRVAQILDASEPCQWRHVDTRHNPADHASRGFEAKEMITCEQWSKGPAFLWKDRTAWPGSTQEENQDLLMHDKEVKEEIVSHSVVAEESGHFDELLERYSSFYRLKRGVAWLLRFVSWLKHGKQTTVINKYLEVNELDKAEKIIFRHMQEKHYSKEIKSLKSDAKEVSRTSSLHQLEPFLDDDDLMRVDGRLKAAPMTMNAVHPVIVPRDHHVTALIVREAHEQSGHSGREHVLSRVREKFWIPKARTLLRKTLRDCTICKRLKSQACGQRMADLPNSRLVKDEPPFSFVGLDCFGPFLVKRGRSQEKRYGLLFTCLTIRAIHIETLNHMDSDSFINALIRFVARRGCPSEIWSDNGSNFVGGEREIREEVEKWNMNPKVNEFLLLKKISWKFNPPTASHMGGVWERQIRTVRAVLDTLLKNDVLDDEKLNTFFCEVEAVVNGRPLTYISDDPKDPEVLTPNHLLLLRAGCPVIATHSRKQDVYGRRWRHVNLLADLFWKRWVKEYLMTLQLRKKWLKPQRNLQEGDIVVVPDEAMPRRVWPLGRVMKANAGKDGLVRSVEVKTSTSVLTRPVHKLHLLEAAPDA